MIWQFISKDKKEIIVCEFKKLKSPNTSPKRIRLIVLNIKFVYKMSYNDLEVSGNVLMNVGFILTKESIDYESFVIKFSIEY